MEGTPADLTVYIDSTVVHDHTYYGNGNTGGVTTPGSSRIVTTRDDENQEMGAYYNFQAATTGTGGAMSTNNTNSPDTFCPLGWQMPYGGMGGDYYDQSKSWKFFFASYGIEFDESPTGITSYPISLVPSGYFLWQSGKLYSFASSATYHTITNANNNNNHRLIINSNGWANPSTAGGNQKVEGHAIRCDCRISILNNSPWHPRSLISIMAFHFLKAHFPSVKIMSNYLKNETKYFIFMELRANFDEAESKYKMENRILMSE